ncbi:MAG: Nramp family divalent metal transporter, partial [candidate division Zixibacteria bacterium]|nr:Nramp family divalent metal transporter [candidate division Zixibacteria bacterium]
VLWMILLSCAIKVPIQSELARHAIATGMTTFQGFDTVPGPRWRVSWLVWASLALLLWSTIQTAGIIGGTGLSLQLLFPQLDGTAWTLILSAVSLLLIFAGHYATVEWITTALVAVFTFTTLASAVLLFWTPYAPTPQAVMDGFRLALPSDGAVTAFSVFGITGVGATELMLYVYWCLEKGYARSTGPYDASASWTTRARGWIGVMHKDAILSMVLYTIATMAFFSLGASVLYQQGKIPQGFDMVATLSDMYTKTLGPWTYYLFGVGAFAVLYSTYFVTIVGLPRMLADILSVIGVVRFEKPQDRFRVIRIITLMLPVLYAILYFTFTAPVQMVIIGGLMQTVLLPAIGFAAYYYSRTTARRTGIAPSSTLLGLVAVCALVMAVFAGYAVWVRL